ncbi:acyl-CoA carboxylase subunit epsilon [Rhodococcus rhodnii]|uniref:Acyl-CoA carboxylase subunit epsilon n=1 Tax=Rhodococcus rhodnii LMG 5362 TaxID=1273125 RepID=R7WJE4_9NOCA|nr:acyl-CoA carboxylase subunit epsilon [Rhodococcus rhodnii]EOM75403.1 hypothetical protein Rrhod_3201 [Rhodococcus rhodnii LMG 5362]
MTVRDGRIDIVRGNPTADDVAALLAVLQAVEAHRDHQEYARMSDTEVWADPRRSMRVGRSPSSFSPLAFGNVSGGVR